MATAVDSMASAVSGSNPSKAHEREIGPYLAELGTSFNGHRWAASPGLSATVAAARLARDGPNRLTPPKELPEIVKFLLEFTNAFMIMLMVAGVLCFVAYGLDTTGVINAYVGGSCFLVVIITCSLSYYQNRASAAVLAALSKMLPASVKVIRDGAERQIPASDLVVGDIVHVQIGDRVPADVRMLWTSDLRVECASLTGESEPVQLGTVCHSPDPVDARNVAFNSSLVMNGEGVGVVIATGDHTMIGTVARLASATTSKRTTMQVEIDRIVFRLTILAVSMAVILFIIGAARGLPILYVVINCFIGVMIANVPEGLPTTVMTQLTITAKRLRESNVFVKKLDIIETLGCATVICSDKTGTLTENRMTVENIWSNRTFENVNTGLRRSANSFVIMGNPLTPAGGASAAGVSPDGIALAVAGPTPMPAAAAGGSVELANAAVNQGSVTALGALSGLMTVGRTVEMRDGVAHMTTSRVRERNYRTIGPAAGDLTWGSSPYSMLLTCATVCNRARFAAADPARPLSASQRLVLGDASDTALFRYCDALRPVDTIRSEFTAVHEQPFNSTDKYAWTVAVCPATFTAPRYSTWARPAGGGGGAGGGAGAGKASDVAAAAPGAAGHLSELSSSLPRSESPTSVASAAPADATTAATATAAAAAAAAASGSTTAASAPTKATAAVSAAAATSTTALMDRILASHGHSQVVFMKGAPERILARCGYHLYNGLAVPIDDDYRTEFQTAYERFGSCGERVLGFCIKFLSHDPTNGAGYVGNADAATAATTDMVFLGLVSLLDPPRVGVDDAVAVCRAASVKVTMVTGDHPLTAEAIARRVGIITQPTRREVAAADEVEEAAIGYDDTRVQAVVVPGSDIPGLSDADWRAILAKPEVVFARTSPDQKLAIVERYQAAGEVVAVTGDGVNDAPALKKANIGIAMGDKGSDVAREAASLVLMDDNFASIVHGIEEGRLVFSNVKKTVAYTLAHLWPEILPIIMNLAFGFPLGLSSQLVLAIDIGSELVPSMSLAYEPAEAAIMAEPPRRVARDHLIDLPVVMYSYLVVGCTQALLSFASYFWVFSKYGITGSMIPFLADKYFSASADPLTVPDGRVYSAADQLTILGEAQAAWYATIVMCQFWHIFMVKTRIASIFRHPSFSNVMTDLGAILNIVFIVLVAYMPGVTTVLGTTAISVQGWITHFGFLVLILAWTEYNKWARRTAPGSWYVRTFCW